MTNINANLRSDSFQQDNFLEIIMTHLQPSELLELAHNEHLLIKLIEFGMKSQELQVQHSFAILSSALHSHKALHASMLVGQSVYISNTPGFFDKHELKAAVELPAAVSELEVQIYNFSLQLVATISLQTQKSGTTYFTWKGILTDGSRAPEGSYTLKASGIIDGQRKNVNTLIAANVDSVALINQGTEVKLNLAGIGLIHFDQVRP